ncbi:ABC transporter permease [Tuberibacillus sp. Marseille-P3662]|uniref:ABC transporter permease n=1 Tax=Tuberibacillus sp. Marseille-P3662 TaxID=1965358 RepID=UPI000A1C8C45|nr:ABC transporter permease [Tuberibacillus sp. Marseille-P3662]
MESQLAENQTAIEQKKDKRDSTFKKIVKGMLHSKLALIGLFIIVVQIFFAVFADLIAPYDPVNQQLSHTNLPPFSPDHWLGTDNYGRDMWSRLVFGARISLVVGITSVAIGAFFGIILGLLAGYYRLLDGLIMRLSDLLFAFPGILLAMLIIAILGSSLVNVVIAISIWSIPTCARIVRGSVLSIKRQEYITAMRSLGASDFRILVKHVLPNCLAPIIVFITMRMATAILSTSSLSFLGLGADPSKPEWGAMIAQGQKLIWTAPHMVIIPGIAIVLVVFAFNVVGDALRDTLDPNMDVDQ